MNAIYLSLINELESIKMMGDDDLNAMGYDYDEFSKREAELVDEIYAMEHPVLKPMTEAELIHFERMIEEE